MDDIQCKNIICSKQYQKKTLGRTEKMKALLQNGFQFHLHLHRNKKKFHFCPSEKVIGAQRHCNDRIFKTNEVEILCFSALSRRHKVILNFDVFRYLLL